MNIPFRVPTQPIVNSTLIEPTYAVEFQEGDIIPQLRELQENVYDGLPKTYKPNIHIVTAKLYRKYFEKEAEDKLKENEQVTPNGIFEISRYENELGIIDIIFV